MRREFEKGIDMKTTSLALMASVAAAPLMAQEHRELSAHVHGVSTLEIAIEGGTVEMRLEAPGMDIVGFEYAPSNETDSMAVDTSVMRLSDPATVVTLPEAAGCEVVEAEAEYELEEHDHDHEEHAEGEDHDHDHEEHAEGEDHDHEHEEHAEGEDHDHEHEEHAEGEDHDHEHEEHAEDEDHDHEEGATHSAFHAHYTFECANPEALTSIEFPFFAQFENAQEIEAQYVTDAGAGSAEVSRDAPEMTLN